MFVSLSLGINDVVSIFSDFGEIMPQWTKVRAKYTKERKLILAKEKSGSEADDSWTKWPHYDAVHELLGKFVKTRKYEVVI